jgi:penicillin-binding protein 2
MSGDRRLLLLHLVALGAFALLGAQAVRMQVLRASHYRELAVAQQVRALPVEPPRGVIMDRTGEVLARNEAAFAIVAIPAELPTAPEPRRTALQLLARASGVGLDAVGRAVDAGLRSVDPFAPVRLRTGLSPADAIAARATLADVSGARVDVAPLRVYTSGDLLPHILGYIGPVEPDQVQALAARGYPLDARLGQGGVEAQYESALRGGAGRLLVAADPAGREIARLGSEPPTPGRDVVLAIDMRLQRAAQRALRDGIASGFPVSGRDADGRPALAAGAAVVLDVRTGEVRAMVTLPSYEANDFSGTPNATAVERLLTDPARPLLDRAFMEVHAPGSIFKPIVALAALQEGVATTETRITSTGAIVVPNQYDPRIQYVFRDWAAHGTLDFNGGIARSSDVYFYYLSGGYRDEFVGLGAERVARYARAFGLGRPTGLDLPGEAPGLVPDPAWKQRVVGDGWLLGDTYTFGIGQGYLTTTPLQMAVATAALANGGDVLVPRVVAGTRGPEGLVASPRLTSGRLPADAKHIAAVREAMRVAASAGGTATEGKPPGIEIGGKTGTAEFGTQLPDGSYDAHAWYIAFAPFDQPEVAVVVYLENGVGATHAAPVARAILQAYFALPATGTGPP